jgi:ATP-binding cassette subfamily C protein
VLTSLVLFALIGLGQGQAGLSTGAFLAFSAAFTQLLLASLSVSSALTAILSAIPFYESVKPVLETLPEVSPAQADPGTLTGEIEISHVAFQYRGVVSNGDEPLVLKDVSLHIKPGEFVAVVGPSGCGKSTLLRLLLKFETPVSGAIFYDGQDLDQLDVEGVRHQVGVVLQDGKLMSGSVLSNIVGSSLLTIDDAWEAARSVGLAQDIEQMPMGMQTVLSEGGGTLSGGQRQRLLIARALVGKPRMLFLDEATSALDNPNQALVSASLERLSATRVVIAHRLSTIANADCIYVLDEGRVVQSGAYAELIRQRGPFAELAKRQLA